MNDHTPAPWYYTDSESGHTWWIETDADAETTAVATAWRSEADARLIAAAPRMLAALKMLVDADQQTAFTIGAWEQEARLIIADVEAEADVPQVPALRDLQRTEG